MASKIQVKRGNKADLPILSDGEYGFCQDTSEIFIGNGGTNTKIYPTTSLDASSVTVEDIESIFESVNVEGALSELGESILDILNGVTTVGKASDANTVRGFTVAKNVPSNAIFTDTVYTHPSSHLPSIISQDANNRFVTDTEKTAWNGKSNFSGSYNDLTNKPTIPDTSTLMPKSGGVLENYREKLSTVSGTSTTINLSLGNVFTHTLSGNTTYTISNAVSGQAHSFTLMITQTATVRTLTFPASVKWQGGEVPDLTTASKTYVLTFMTINGGTNWLGMFGGEF